jgi:hypothetical protein
MLREFTISSYRAAIGKRVIKHSLIGPFLSRSIAAARRSAFRRVAADFHIGMTMVLKMAPAEHKARNVFKIAESFRPPTGAVASPCWPDSPEAEFVICGTICGQTVLVQRLGILNLDKEKI